MAAGITRNRGGGKRVKNIKRETGYFSFREIYSNRLDSFTHKKISTGSDAWLDQLLFDLLFALILVFFLLEISMRSWRVIFPK